jgi:hypothetical protein
MSSSTIYELIGYLASILIVISLAMSSVIRLRVVNLAGAVVFSIYGALIGSLPVLITNLVITGLDVFYLYREVSTRDELGIVAVDRDDEFLAAFIDQHGDDMASFGFRPGEASDVQFVMLRNTTLAGVFLGRVRGDGELEVIIDYVAPPFRDLRSGRCLYHDGGARFAALGFRALVVPRPDRRQDDYLEAMGFEPETAGMVKRVG